MSCELEMEKLKDFDKQLDEQATISKSNSTIRNSISYRQKTLI